MTTGLHCIAINQIYSYFSTQTTVALLWDKVLLLNENCNNDDSH